MRQLFAAMRAQAAIAGSGATSTRTGTVTSYDPNTYSVKVKIQPEGQVIGDVPLVSPWIGNSWGLFAPPSIGDQIEVHYREGEDNAAYAAQRFYNDADRPLPCPSGEFWVVHKSGSLLKFLNTGDVQLVTAQDLNVTVGRDVNATVTRNLTASVGQDASLTVTRNLTANVNGNATATVAGALTANITGNASLSVGGTLTSSASQWNHTGPVKVIGTLMVTSAITGQGGMAISGGGGGGTATFSGNVQVTGSVTSTGDMVAAGISLDSHVHSGVTTGGSNTGGPH